MQVMYDTINKKLDSIVAGVVEIKNELAQRDATEEELKNVISQLTDVDSNLWDIEEYVEYFAKKKGR